MNGMQGKGREWNGMDGMNGYIRMMMMMMMMMICAWSLTGQTVLKRYKRPNEEHSPSDPDLRSCAEFSIKSNVF